MMTDRNPLTDPEPGDVLRDRNGRLIEVKQVACMRPLWVVVDIGPEFEHPRRWWAADMWRIYVDGAVVVKKGA